MDTLPLARFRVLDLSRVRSGPTAVRQLADWGADVLMIEPPQGADLLVGPREGSDFQNLNRNKRSLTLDLKREEARAILYQLVRDADVVVENFRPAVKRRLGVDYATLAAINPRLVYASISGFGEDGPYADRPGVDQIAQGMGGLMSITGLPGQGPVRAGIAICDTASGLYAALGILTALLEREATGRGRWVRTSLLQAQVALLDFQATRWLVDRDLPRQMGNDHPSAAPMGTFHSADGIINIAASTPQMFAAFCAVADCTALIDDARYATLAARRDNRDVLNATIAALIRERPTAHWVERLNRVGVPCGPVNTIDQVFADPQVKHLGMVAAVESEQLGTLDLVAQPIIMDGIEFRLRNAAPQLGEHSSEVLDALGYDAATIEDLRARGVI